MLLIVAVLVALTIGVAAVYFSGSSSTVTPAGGPPDAVAAGPDVARVLEGLAADPDAGVAAGAREELAGRARTAIPEGSTLRPFPDTWAPDGLGGGSMLVDVTAPGRVPVGYLAVVVPEGGTWKVLATIPVTNER